MDLQFELSFPGHVVAGIDEAGRGPLAGPVVAAAVILNQDKIPAGINDSKKLSANKREKLYDLIIQDHHTSTCIIGTEEIDKINILQATIKACWITAENLPFKPSIILVDGNMKFSDQRFISIIKGDSKSLSIAAASIVAKVTRDRLMTALAKDYPYYGWQQNFGYGTKGHIEAIAKYGLSPHHRKSFKVKL